MAEYIAMGRSNYFRVTDEERWNELSQGLCGDWTDHEKEIDGITHHVLYIDGSLDWVESEGDSAYESNIDYFLDELQKILPDNECFIYEEIGNEKFRYVVGEAVCVTKDEITWINLDRLARKWAEERLGTGYIARTSY